MAESDFDGAWSDMQNYKKSTGLPNDLLFLAYFWLKRRNFDPYGAWRIRKEPRCGRGSGKF